jgi:hypothetical protein
LGCAEASGGGGLGRTAGLSTAAAHVVRGEAEKGRKEEEERDDVAA